MGTLTNSDDPDETPHNDNAAFHLGLLCLLKVKWIFKEMQYFR